MSVFASKWNLEENMDEVITTIYFDGQFWAALIEKISADGTVRIGRHVFGAEPDRNDILNFYQNIYAFLPLRDTRERVRLKKIRSYEEQNRRFSQSLELYKQSRTEYLLKRKSERRERKILSNREKYEKQREKKKARKRH
jgi:hypothetical protein